MGFKTTDVYRIITSAFGINIGIEAFYSHVSRVFGDIKEIHYRLLKPVVERIIEERSAGYQYPLVPSAIDIYWALKDIGGYISGKSWFADWSRGRIIFDADFNKVKSYITTYYLSETTRNYIKHYYRRYCGATWLTWEKWALNGLSNVEINNILAVGVKRINDIYFENGGYNNIQKEARKKVTMELLSLGVDPLAIYYKTFKMALQKRAKEGTVYSYIKEYFESLFDNKLTYEEIIDTDWTSQYEGWIHLYGLMKGKDY